MESKKRGRPNKEATRSYVAKARLNEEEFQLLNHLEFRTGMSKSNILRAALRVYYHTIMTKN